MAADQIDALRKLPDAHKYQHGHALVLSGGPGQTGAARLAARGALRIGAGLVTLGVPPAAQMEVSAQVTAIMLLRVPDAAALSDALNDARISVLCAGPGLGVARAAALLPEALGAARPSVLDADALTAIGRDGALFDMLHPACVLTPHGGEFARLFPDLADALEMAPLAARAAILRTAARRAGCTIVLKGPDTLVAAPSGECAVHSARGDDAAPWLATAGAGDVLAGMIAGLLARGQGPYAAARSAVWLHAACGRHCGPGLIAEDLPEALPAVLASLGV
ncbi:NAD(P)H-hydrate dehydratase [Pelagivirga sediminicola]|uniref:ADP-dependent (S)-NAD(P)H-hydrate dehydratase n=2 Tax=Pelagivirga sediminicola TaxID=2170575 RepID=A0A2T7G5W4_9RHOB|nr:NAD(P)H-hydrate dehydratase [Pelagivirga sediminicola]